MSRNAASSPPGAADADLSQLSGSIGRIDPLLGFNFLVSITDSQPAASSALAGISISLSGSQATAGFSEISGLEATMDVENYDAGGVNSHALKFPGRVKWSNLVFKRGVIAQRPISDTSDFWTWLQSFLDGHGVRKDGVITLLDEIGRPRPGVELAARPAAQMDRRDDERATEPDRHRAARDRA